MSLATALDSLRARSFELRGAAAELAMISLEDHPDDDTGAVYDDLAETVSEFQAAVESVANTAASADAPRRLPEIMTAVADAHSRCTKFYWRGLRNHEVVADLRRHAHRRGMEWQTWQRSLEASQVRCEQPLSDLDAAVRICWHEIAELLTLYLPAQTDPDSTQLAQGGDDDRAEEFHD